MKYDKKTYRENLKLRKQEYDKHEKYERWNDRWIDHTWKGYSLNLPMKLLIALSLICSMHGMTIDGFYIAKSLMNLRFDETI